MGLLKKKKTTKKKRKGRVRPGLWTMGYNNPQSHSPTVPQLPQIIMASWWTSWKSMIHCSCVTHTESPFFDAGLLSLTLRVLCVITIRTWASGTTTQTKRRKTMKSYLNGYSRFLPPFWVFVQFVRTFIYPPRQRYSQTQLNKYIFVCIL